MFFHYFPRHENENKNKNKNKRSGKNKKDQKMDEKQTHFLFTPFHADKYRSELWNLHNRAKSYIAYQRNINCVNQKFRVEQYISGRLSLII